MNKQFLAGILIIAMLLPASAAIYSTGNVNGSGTSLNLAIPDANPNGIYNTILVVGAGTALADVNVTLNVSGGYNGDLYAYLSYNGTLVTLLNRVGTGGGNNFGYSASGFNNITLDDQSGNGSIHNVSNPSANSSYMPDSSGNNLTAFNGSNPNGTWTLFFADLSGGNVSTLNGWSLDIEPVPEPVTIALGVFAGFLIFCSILQVWKRRASLR